MTVGQHQWTDVRIGEAPPTPHPSPNTHWAKGAPPRGVLPAGRGRRPRSSKAETGPIASPQPLARQPLELRRPAADCGLGGVGADVFHGAGDQGEAGFEQGREVGGQGVEERGDPGLGAGYMVGFPAVGGQRPPKPRQDVARPVGPLGMVRGQHRAQAAAMVFSTSCTAWPVRSLGISPTRIADSFA